MGRFVIVRNVWDALGILAALAVLVGGVCGYLMVG